MFKSLGKLKRNNDCSLPKKACYTVSPLFANRSRKVHAKVALVTAVELHISLLKLIFGLLI